MESAERPMPRTPQWAVVEGGAEPLAIMHILQEMADAGAGLGDRLVLVEVDFFILQGCDEAFDARVVVGHGATTQATLDVVRGQQRSIDPRGIPHAAIQLMQQLWCQRARGQHHL